MAQELLLVNPRRRHRRRRRSMSALQRRYFGVRRNPRKRRRRTAALAGPAPARKVSRRRRRRMSSGRRSFARRMGGMRGFSINSFLNNTLVPAGIGAAGALGTDLALKYAQPYLPAFLQSGIGYSLARIGGAVAVGYVAGMGLGKARGEQAMAGAITVTLYDLFKSQIGASLGLQGLGMYVGTDRGMGWISPALQAGTGMHGLGMYVGSEKESDYIRSY